MEILQSCTKPSAYSVRCAITFSTELSVAVKTDYMPVLRWCWDLVLSVLLDYPMGASQNLAITVKWLKYIFIFEKDMAVQTWITAVRCCLQSSLMKLRTLSMRTYEVYWLVSLSSWCCGCPGTGIQQQPCCLHRIMMSHDESYYTICVMLLPLNKLCAWRYATWWVSLLVADLSSHSDNTQWN